MAQQQSVPQEALIAAEARANIFGFPLVLMDVTRQVATAVSTAAGKQHKAPINRLVHLREFPDPSFSDIVSPNADTLYSVAFLDLKNGPMILSVPAMGDRYYLIELLDAWTNVVASIGTRTTGRGAGSFAIVGPSWTGELPFRIDEVRSPTNLVWLLGRTQTNGKKDYAAVHALQNQIELAPLGGSGTPYPKAEDAPVPEAVDVTTPPLEQVAKMDAATFFGRLNALMKDNPPAPADAEAMAAFAKVGVVPGRGFDAKTVDPAVVESADEGAREGLRQIVTEAKKQHGKVVNGWAMMTNVGRYGTDYLWRAVVATVGLGANLPEDALYPRATTDRDGRPLSGEDRYVIQFAEGELPPVRAFWSVTMYNEKQAFVENPICRYAIGDRDALSFDDDGTLTLYVQHESPGKDRESNWLPAPKGAFNLIMRLYWPKDEILDGSWRIPPVKRVTSS